MDKKLKRIIQWQYQPEIVTNMPGGVIQEGDEMPNLDCYTTLADFNLQLKLAYDAFYAAHPGQNLTAHDVYVHLCEDDLGRGTLEFCWMEKESDEDYEKRCKVAERVMMHGEIANRAQLKTAIMRDPALAKEILNELGL